MGPVVAAVSVMIDLACESRDVDYFRSEDPVEAARFVVSDAVRAGDRLAAGRCVPPIPF